MSRKTKLSHLRRPAHLAPEVWQRQLRRQFGREQKLRIENLGDEPIFSEYRVSNPKSGGAYRVAIRGMHPGDNFCACPDFATNDLGTCKHIEFVLARIERRPGGVRALRRGFRPRYSEIYLRYGGERQVLFRAGSSCPPDLARKAKTLFDAGSANALASSKYLELDGFIRSNEKPQPVQVASDTDTPAMTSLFQNPESLATAALSRRLRPRRQHWRVLGCRRSVR